MILHNNEWNEPQTKENRRRICNGTVINRNSTKWLVRDGFCTKTTRMRFCHKEINRNAKSTIVYATSNATCNLSWIVGHKDMWPRISISRTPVHDLHRLVVSHARLSARVQICNEYPQILSQSSTNLIGLDTTWVSQNVSGVALFLWWWSRNVNGDQEPKCVANNGLKTDKAGSTN